MENLIGLLPFLLLLACPLLMVFMMRGMSHGSHNGDGRHSTHGCGHDAAEKDPAAKATDDRLRALEDELASLRRARSAKS